MNTYQLIDRLSEAKVICPRYIGFKDEAYVWSGEWIKVSKMEREQTILPDYDEAKWMLSKFDTKFMDAFDVANLATLADIISMGDNYLIVRYWGECYLLSREKRFGNFNIHATVNYRPGTQCTNKDIEKYLLSDKEIMYLRRGVRCYGYGEENLSTDKLLATIKDEDTTVLRCDFSSNNYGDWLFVSLKFKGYIVHFYGAGYHHSKERHIYQTWAGFSSNDCFYEKLSPLDKGKVIHQIKSAVNDIKILAANDDPRRTGYEVLTDEIGEDDCYILEAAEGRFDELSER